MLQMAFDVSIVSNGFWGLPVFVRIILTFYRSSSRLIKEDVKLEASEQLQAANTSNALTHKSVLAVFA